MMRIRKRGVIHNNNVKKNQKQNKNKTIKTKEKKKEKKRKEKVIFIKRIIINHHKYSLILS